MSNDGSNTIEILLLWATVLVGLGLVCERLDAVVLELKRANTMLELQYFEMEWSAETLAAYCEENPEGCEVTE